MLLDTNATSAIGENDDAIMCILADAESIMLPFASVAEFRFRPLGSSRPEPGLLLFERLAESAGACVPDAETLAHYAWISDHLKRKGRPIPHNDIWIAALARQHSLEIFSRDTHFDHSAGLVRIAWEPPLCHGKTRLRTPEFVVPFDHGGHRRIHGAGAFCLHVGA
jgi:tRNA(fMet)-specific endonuclease VapC